MDSAPTQTTPNIKSVPLEHDGALIYFTFSWGVFEALYAEWGEDYQKNLNELMVGRDLSKFRYVASLCSGVQFGPDTVLPVQRVINTLYRAHEIGWSGRDVGPIDRGESEPTGKKPRRRARPSTDTSTRGSRWGWTGRLFSPRRRTRQPER